MKRRALRRRYGRARDMRKPWHMLHRGEDMGFIHAHDRGEALAIAHDAAPPSWRKSDIDVRAASFGHARAAVRMFPAFDPEAHTRKTRVVRHTELPTLHDAPPPTRRYADKPTREVQYIHWGRSR